MFLFVFFFFKQKTAYEMRISDGVQTCALPISRLLVRAVGGVHEPSDHRPAGVAAGAGRHDLRGRRAAGGLVRGPAVDFARTRNDAGDGNRKRRLRPTRRQPGRGGLALPEIGSASGWEREEKTVEDPEVAGYINTKN